jgi:hypothetical protein
MDVPATKKDLVDLEARLDAEFDAKMTSLKDALKESRAGQIRDSQTGVLKAFLSWQESSRIQFRKPTANMGKSRDRNGTANRQCGAPSF